MRIKTLLLVLFATLSTTITKAALPDGSPATDWTLTDLNGNVHNLFDELNAGKHVIIDYSATWCSPCWSYHNTGILEEMYDLYGPNGTDQIRVYYIEADQSTNDNCLTGNSGCNSSTQGNWVAGTGYPIMNPIGSDYTTSVTNYGVTYYPTLYGISANNFKVYEIAQASQQTWEEWIFESFDMGGTVVIDDGSCANPDGFIDFSLENGYGSVSYQWSNGATTQDIYAESGSYTLSLTDTHGYVQEMGPYTIDFDPDGTIDVQLTNISQSTCYNENNGTITVEGYGGEGNYSYVWDNNSTSATINNLAPGDYTVIVTDDNGCDNTETYTITQPEPITYEIEQIDETCTDTNGSIEITSYGGDGNFSYNIGNGYTTNNYFDNLEAGSYQISISDGNTCQSMAFVQLANTVAPIAMSSVLGILDCCNPSITLYSTGSTFGSNIGYQWTTSNGILTGPTTNATATAIETGLYTLEVIDNASGCSSFSDVQVNSAILPYVESDISNIITCDIPQAQLTAILDTNLILDLDYTTMWTDPNGEIIVDENSLTLVVNEAGEYTIQIIYLDNCCDTSIIFLVEEDIEIPWTPPFDEYLLTCDNSTVMICALYNPNYEYNWVGPNGESSETNCIEASTIGEYCATLISTTNGCISTFCATVSASNDTPTLDISYSTPEAIIGCNGNGIVLTANSNSDFPSYEWFLNNESEPIGIENTVTANELGEYTLVLTDTESNCQATSIVNVVSPPDIIPEAITTDLSCFGSNNGIISVIVNENNEDYTISWDFLSTDFTISNLTSGTYTGTILDNYGCQLDVNYTITEPTIIEQTDVMITNATPGNYDGNIDLTLEGGTPGYTITLSNTTEAPSNLIAGTYYLTAVDDNGCSQEFGPFDVLDIVGLNAIIDDNIWDISPNPFFNTIQIKTTSNHNEINISLQDISGKIVYSSKALRHQNSINIDTENLSSGVYFLRMASNISQHSIKLIKQ